MRGVVALIGIALIAGSAGGIAGMQSGFWFGLCIFGLVAGVALFIDAMIREK